MWLIYQLAYAVALLFAGPFLLLRRGRHYLTSLRGRLGLDLPDPAGRPLWLHAVSVGEVGVAATLAAALPAELPLLVTTVTPTGQERARALFAGRAQVAYLPFDLGPPVRRFFLRCRPAALVLAEGDLWPLVLRRARREGLPMAVVNGRVSDRSFARLRRLSGLVGPLFDGIAVFGVQTPADAERLRRLGVSEGRIVTTGNLKFETDEPPERPELERLVGRLAAGRPVLVAGSTMAGEEESVLRAFTRLGGGERALLVLAPRHPERFDAVAARIEAAGLALARRSSPDGVERPSVLLLDTLGELASLYRHTRAAFVGGTLVPTGGHNPLEAARFGVPVAVGPSMENFRAMAEEFDRRRAWARVAGVEDLAAIWRAWIEDPAEAERVGGLGERLVADNRGALARTLELLRPVIAAAEEGAA
ncbi:MAG: 3-deoxy-D-manno-octulosonic acid transferase [Thermoanaerobaculia bacterium]|nr:3-deoxy-D-manno-octulosonic acid transferase [Thermoanaerobaculia bacterium]